MKLLLLLLLALSSAAVGQTIAPTKNPPPAATSKEQAHRNEDIARHRQMARAHEEVARCLEGGTAERSCQERLREACKGIAIGQYCGMRHGH